MTNYIVFTDRVVQSLLRRKEYNSLDGDKAQELLEIYLGLMEEDKVEIGRITAYKLSNGIWILDREDIEYYKRNGRLSSLLDSVIISDIGLLSSLNDDNMIMQVLNEIFKMQALITQSNALLPSINIQGNEVRLKVSDSITVQVLKANTYIVYGIGGKTYLSEPEYIYSKQYSLLGRTISASSSVMEYSFEYKQFYNKLTQRQRLVIDSDILTMIPLRIAGAAGTGKTTAMVLKAYSMLVNARNSNQELRILFVSHSQSTYRASKKMFTQLAFNNFSDKYGMQYIHFSSVMDACTDVINMRSNNNSRLTVKVLNPIESELKIKRVYMSMRQKLIDLYKSKLSPLFMEVLTLTSVDVIVSLLRQEIEIQVSGHSHGDLEKYVMLKPLVYGLPVSNERALSGSLQYADKYFVYSIYNEYNKLLKSEDVYSSSDMAIEAYGHLRGPIWNRERELYGYDFIFIDEIHMLDYYEQIVIELMLNRTGSYNIVCTMDYGQAFGDQGEVALSYLESRLLRNSKNIEFDSVMRSTIEISEFCHCIIQSGLSKYGNNFVDSYSNVKFNGGVTDNGNIPNLLLCNSENIGATFINTLKSALKVFNPRDILVIQLDSSIKLDKLLRQYLLNYSQQIQIFNQYEINGVEFKCVIVVGVDGGILSDAKSPVVRNCLLYKAHNIVYLSASRASKKLIMLGNNDKGRLECLDGAISKGKLIVYKNY